MRKIRVTFVKRRKYIFIRVIADSLRFEFSTGYKIPRLATLYAGGLIGRQSSAGEINEKIQAKKKEVQDKVNKLIEADINVPFEHIKSYILGQGGEIGEDMKLSGIVKRAKRIVESGKVMNKVTGKPLAPLTLQRKGVTYKRIIDCLEGCDIDIRRYNAGTFNMYGPEKIRRIYRDSISTFKNNMIRLKYNDSTISHTIGDFKSLIQEAAGDANIWMGNLLNDLNYKSPDYQVEIITTEQARFILNQYDKIKSDITSRSDEVALDYWVAALSTAARFGDMQSWTTENLKEDGDNTWLSYIPSKTRNSSGNTVTCPVGDLLKRIFTANAFGNNGKLLPYIDRSNVGKRMRQIAKRYEIFGNKITRTRLYGGVQKTETIPAWKTIHIHQMRATAITLMLEAGVPEQVVKQFSAHVTDSKSFRRYVANMSKDTMKNYYDQYKKSIAM